jgi:hypothetical protein
MKPRAAGEVTEVPVAEVVARVASLVGPRQIPR